MPVTSTIEGTFRVNNRTVDGAVAYLIPSAVFGTAPAQGDTIPTASSIATCTTGPANGGNGAYRFLNQPQAEYYVAIPFAGTSVFDYHNSSAVGIGASGQLVLNTAAQFGGTMFHCLVNGVPKFAVTTDASGTTHWASGQVGMNGPWSYAASTTQAPPPHLKLTQHRTSVPSGPVSGHAVYINFDDRWAFGCLDSTNPSDLSPSYGGASWPGGGSAMFWADLRQNENRMILDSDGELRLETKNPLNFGNGYNFTLQRVSSTAGAVSGIAQTGTGYGFGIGWRCVMPIAPDGIATSFQSELFDVHGPTTIFSIYNKLLASDYLHMRLHEQGGLWIPGGPFTKIAVGGELGCIRAGNDLTPSFSTSGTIFAGATKSGFGGNWIDFQVAGIQAMQVAANGTTTHYVVDSSPTGLGNVLQLGHRASGTPANGVCTSIQFLVQNSAGTLGERGCLRHQMTAVTPTNESSQWLFTASSSGTEATVLTITGSGDVTPAGAIYGTAPANPNRGSLNLGLGGFTGAGTSFAGSANGTLFAVNAASAYRGDLANLQVSGSTKFKVDCTGAATIAGDLSHTGAKTGFNGTAAIAKQTLSGVKSGGTALTNLIAALVNVGLISDSTT